jgi:hypothetical protein
MSRRCTATRSDGSPCSAWAVPGTDPPRCAPHGGGARPVGAPRGNQNARVHGFYAASDQVPLTIDDVIADLAAKQALLSEYIENHLSEIADDVTAKRLIRVFAIHGENASRLGRLMVARQALMGGPEEGIAAAIAEALAEMEAGEGIEPEDREWT